MKPFKLDERAVEAWKRVEKAQDAVKLALRSKDEHVEAVRRLEVAVAEYLRLVQ